MEKEKHSELLPKGGSAAAKYGYYEGKSVTADEFEREVKQYGLKAIFGEPDVYRRLSVRDRVYTEETVDVGMARGLAIDKKEFDTAGEALAYLLFRMHVNTALYHDAE